MSNVSEIINQGIAAVKSNNLLAARVFLINAIKLDETSELAWLWLSGAVETNEERKYCMEKVLRINPGSEVAKKGLVTLHGVSTVSPIIDTQEEEIIILNKPNKVHKLNYGRQLRSIALSPNNLFVAVINEDLKLSSWRISDRKCMWHIEDFLADDNLTYSPDGRYIAVATGVAIQIFDANNGNLVHTINIYGDKVIYSKDGKRIFRCNPLEKEAYIIDVQRKTKLQTIKLPSTSLNCVD